MNFSLHKDRVETALEYAMQRKEALAQVIAAVKERASIEKESAKRLARLSESPFPSFNTPGMSSLVSGD